MAMNGRIVAAVTGLALVAGWFWLRRPAVPSAPAPAAGPTTAVASPQIAASAAVTAPPTEAAPTAIIPAPALATAAPPGIAGSLSNDPDWTAREFAAAVVRVEARYGRFFGRLGWPADRIEALKRRLAADDLTLMKAALTAPAGGMTAEAARARQDEIERLMARQREALASDLGGPDFARLESCEREEACRGVVGDMANAMRAQGVAVSGDVEERLVTEYAAAQQAAAGGDPHRLQQELIRRLSGVLSREQLDAFLASQLEQGGG